MEHQVEAWTTSMCAPRHAMRRRCHEHGGDVGRPFHEVETGEWSAWSNALASVEREGTISNVDTVRILRVVETNQGG